MNNQSRVALLALLMLALVSTNMTRRIPSAHGDPASMSAGSARFLPLPQRIGILEPIMLTTPDPQSLISVTRQLQVQPSTVPVTIKAEGSHHYLIMPRTDWPAKTRITFIWGSGQVRASTTTDDGRAVVVDLTRQRLTAWENGRAIKSFPVSTGVTPDWVTPTGTFWIYKRVLDDHMVGGDPSTADHWDVHHVPYAQYFTGAVAIHGAWWNHRFGRPVSPGCVQLATNKGPHGPTGDPPDAAWLWNFTDIGTPVIVTGHTPVGTAMVKEPLAYPAPSFHGPISARSAASYIR